jgi:iron complex outermembrane receptor protein
VIPAYREAQLRSQFYVPAFSGFIQETDQQASLEARFSGDRIGIFSYILGAFYFDEDVAGNYTFAQTQLNSYQDFKLGTESYALFGRVTAHLADSLRLVGGLRYTNDTKYLNGRVETVVQQCRNAAAPPACPTAPFLPLTDRADQLNPINGFNTGFPGAVPVLVGGVPTGAFNARLGADINVRQKADKVTYRAAVEFDVGPRSLLYASFETGFRSGGFALTIGKETFGPETLDAFTVGMKNRLFDNRLQLNVEGFYWKYKDQQIAHFGLDRNGANSFFTENLGRSTVKGIEADAQFLLTRTTLLTGNVQYLDSVFDDFRYLIAAPAATAPLPAVGCPYGPAPARPGAPAELLVDCSGKPAFQSPKWTVTAGIQQTIPLGEYNIVLNADTQYKSERVIGFEYLPGQFAPSFWRSNAAVTFARDDDQWAISGFVNNIEGNRNPLLGTFYSGANIITRVSSDPRTYGVRASVKF